MKKFTLCVLLFCAQLIQAQMSVSTVQTPAELVQNVLVGEGVTPFNITFNGAPATAARLQAGHFTTNFNPTNLGITEGMILSTGNSRDAPGPNSGAGHTSSGGNIQINDVDLDILTTNTVTNVTVVEFDFVATGLELNFDYIFASEEYPEYVFSTGGYNDVFGFFLRGPGITGPFTGNARNLAVVPNTTIPITVNTINNGYNNNGMGAVNPALFYNNTHIGQNPTTWTSHTVEFDGFTQVLRASAALICGETYHIKLAIANCGDQGWDSAVFLKNFRIKPFELLGNSSVGGSTGSGVPICPGEQVVIASGITDQGFTYDWSVDGTSIPGPHGPDLTIPASNGPSAVSASALVAGTRYQILSVGTTNPTDFTLVGSTNNLPLQIFTATGPATGDGIAVPVVVYELKYYTSTGCFLGSDTYDLTYVNFGLRDITQINKCFPESATVPPQYSFGNLNVDVTDFMLNSLPVGDFDIRHFDNPTDAYSFVPPAGISQAELSNYTISTSGTLYVRFESFSRGCIFVKEVDLNVDIKPDGSFSYAGPYCVNASAPPVAPSLNNLTPGGTFNPSSAGLIVNPVTGEIDLALSSPGSYTVNYHIPASPIACGVFDVNVPVVITSAMAAPTVTTPIIYCQGESASPLSVAGPGLMWYDLPVGGTGSATTPTPDTTIPGTKLYYVSQNGGCESPRSEIRVEVNAKPAPPTFTPVAPYCQNDAAAPLSPVGSNLLWYTSAASATGSVTPPVISTLTAGITSYFVTQTVNNCESDKTEIQVEVIARPLAPNVTPTVTYCQNTSAAPLTTLNGANLLWYLTTSPAETGNPTAPTPVTTGVGNTIYYVSQTVNGCEGPRAPITVSVTGIPAAPFVTPTLVYCQNEVAQSLSLSATGTSLLWYNTPTGGTGSATAPTPDTASPGSTDYYVSQTIGCEGPREKITVSVTPTPPMPSVTAVAYCQHDTPGVLTAVGANLLWYTSPVSGTGSATPPPVSTLTPGNTTYYVTQTVSGCESDWAQLVVTVNALPAAPSGPPPTQPTCTVPTGTIVITAPVGANLEYSIDSGINYQPQTTFDLLTPNASYSIIVRNTATGCVSAASVFNIQVAPTFPATPAVAASDVCIGEPINLTTPAVAGATYSWTGPNGFTSSVQNPSIPNSTLAMSGTYSLVISTGADCPSNPGTVHIVVNPLPQPSLQQDGYICYNAVTNVGSPYVLNSGLDNTTYDFEWFSGATYTPVSGETQSTYTVTAPGAYAVRATNVVTGCVSPMVTTNVGMSSPPLHVIAVAAEYFADIQSITINVSPPGNYEYQLDNGAFQAGNMFSNLLPGTHTVTVRNECGELSTSAYLMDFPRFFTPNGDGYNDTWNIFALNTQAKAKIYIFDRYGKLIKQISPGGKGWDGMLNEQILPSTDYWFTVEYEENSVRKEFKSHFALKR